MHYLVVLQVSNAFAAEANTGDLAFREHADENRAGFKGRLEIGCNADAELFDVFCLTCLTTFDVILIYFGSP